MKIAKEPCPKCGGEVMMDYKSRPWLGKCIKCSRVWNVRGVKSKDV